MATMTTGHVAAFHGVDCVPLTNNDDINALGILVEDVNGTGRAVRVRTDFINSFKLNSSR